MIIYNTLVRLIKRIIDIKWQPIMLSGVIVAHMTSALAEPVVVPPALSPGDQYRLAFVTSTGIDATSADIAVYNAFVQGIADAEPMLEALETTWKAIGSTESVVARENTNTDYTSTPVGVPIYRLDGNRIAATNNDLWNLQNVENNIGIDETGAILHSYVWTGTIYWGVQYFPLGRGIAVGVGNSAVASEGKWIFYGPDDIPWTRKYPLYAISDVLTVPSGEPLACTGFLPPVGDNAVMVKKHRAVPFKARLQDESGQYVDDGWFEAPPVIQVVFKSAAGSAAFDVTEQAVPVGFGTDGNQFEFVGDAWQFNLKTKNNYTAVGTYGVTMESGDKSEYVINPTCRGTFVIEAK